MTPFTCQVTAVFAEFEMVAVNCCVFVTFRVAAVGATEIVTAGVIVTIAEADFDVSAIDVAVSVTVFSVGAAAGAA